VQLWSTALLRKQAVYQPLKTLHRSYGNQSHIIAFTTVRLEGATEFIQTDVALRNMLVSRRWANEPFTKAVIHTGLFIYFLNFNHN
jgi:hypothetical protein